MLGLIGAGMFLDAFDIYLAGGVLGALVKEGWSTVQMNATFIFMTFIGMVIGAWSAGILGDRFGRRFSYQFNLALFGLASLAAAFAPSIEWLIAARFVIGIGLGAEIVVGYGTLTEFVPARYRGRWIAMLAVITNFSLFVSSIVGLWVIPTFGWRYMFVIVGVFGMVVWFLRKGMPESPRWLEAQGRNAEAEAILSAVEAEATARGKLPAVNSGAMREMPITKGSIVDVFSPANIRGTLLGSLLHIVVGFSLYGFIGWLPTFFVKAGFSVISSLQYTTLMSLGGPVGALIGWAIADSVGRKPAIIGSSLAAAAFGIAYTNVGDGWPLMAVGFGLVTSVYIMLTTGFAMYVPELFPTHLRMRGSGFAATIGRLTTAVVQYAVIAVFAWAGLVGVLSILIGLLIFQALMIAIFAVETKGRSLESISRSAEEEAASANATRRLET
jgi:putative MFS transporter